MTRTTTDRPTDAEMIQTACRRVGSAILAIEGADTTPIGVVHLFESQAFVLVPTDGDAVAAVDGAEVGRPAVDGGSGRTRRVPHRLERGAIDGSVEATDQLLRLGGVDVVVDGYNVSMEAWPHLDAASQRERLLALLTAATARSGAHVHVVFDGDDDGRRPSVASPLAVRVHYTPAGVEADDLVIAMANDLPVDRPVVVVSSDRRVQDGARRAGANVVSSSALLAWDRR